MAAPTFNIKVQILDMSVTTINPKGGTISNHPIPKTFIQVLAVCMDKRCVDTCTYHISVGGCSCMWGAEGEAAHACGGTEEEAAHACGGAEGEAAHACRGLRGRLLMHVGG